MRVNHLFRKEKVAREVLAFPSILDICHTLLSRAIRGLIFTVGAIFIYIHSSRNDPSGSVQYPPSPHSEKRAKVGREKKQREKNINSRIREKVKDRTTDIY